MTMCCGERQQACLERCKERQIEPRLREPADFPEKESPEVIVVDKL
jgi:hypothetical protein